MIFFDLVFSVNFQNEFISKMAEENDIYPLHESVFKNDIKKLSRLLRKYDVSQKDKHGKYFKIVSKTHFLGVHLNYFIFGSSLLKSGRSVIRNTAGNLIF